MDTPTPPDLQFQVITDLIREHARARPGQPALVGSDTSLSYAALDALMDRVAASLQRDGLKAGETIAICAHASPRYAAVFLGALRAGAAVAPLAPSVTAASFASMLGDAQAKCLFVDAAATELLPSAGSVPHCISLDARSPGQDFEQWLVAPDCKPAALRAGSHRAVRIRSPRRARRATSACRAIARCPSAARSFPTSR